MILPMTTNTPCRLSGQRYVTSEPAEVGLEISYPPDSPRTPSAQLKDISVDGPYKTGIRLVNCWNATLEDPFVTHIESEEQNANPTKMLVGIDIGTSMDTHISRPRVLNARVGIRVGDPDQANPARAEGIHIGEGGWIQHAMTGVELHGKMGGGWPCPSAMIALRHINFLQYGVFIHNYSGVHIKNMDLYGSHYRPELSKWAIYLVGCKEVEISGNHFWKNSAGPVNGIVLDGCEDVEIHGGVISAGIEKALWSTPTCKRIRTYGSAWDYAAKMGKVFNQAS